MFKKTCFFLVLVHSLLAAVPSQQTSEFYVDYKKAITDLYHNIDAVIPDAERECVSKTGGSPVYGEILFESVNTLLAELNLTKDDVFYDLGSGLGRFVTQVYLMSPAKKSVGIEFSESRHKRAASIQSQLPKLYKETFKFENSMRTMFGKPTLPKIKGKAFEFIKGDMLEADLSDATVVFTCSTCFSDEFMQKIADKLATINNLRIISLKKLPHHNHIHYVGMHTLSMTWSSDVPVYMYKVDQSKNIMPEEAMAEVSDFSAATDEDGALEDFYIEEEDGFAAIV